MKQQICTIIQQVSCWHQCIHTHVHTHTQRGCLAVIQCTIDSISIYNSWYNAHLSLSAETHTTQTASFWEAGREETQYHSLYINLNPLIHTQSHTSLASSYHEFIHLNLVFTSPSLPHSSLYMSPLFLHSQHITKLRCHSSTLLWIILGFLVPSTS